MSLCPLCWFDLWLCKCLGSLRWHSDSCRVHISVWCNIYFFCQFQRERCIFGGCAVPVIGIHRLIMGKSGRLIIVTASMSNTAVAGAQNKQALNFGTCARLSAVVHTTQHVLPQCHFQVQGWFRWSRMYVRCFDSVYMTIDLIFLISFSITVGQIVFTNHFQQWAYVFECRLFSKQRWSP